MADLEITQDDLFDLGFEPLVTENKKSMDYEHPELGNQEFRTAGITVHHGVGNQIFFSRFFFFYYQISAADPVYRHIITTV